MREEGFYKVKVTEFSGTMSTPFWTIGLWYKYSETFSTWLFADGDGEEFGTSFTILEIDETLIMKHRDYENI